MLRVHRALLRDIPCPAHVKLLGTRGDFRKRKEEKRWYSIIATPRTISFPVQCFATYSSYSPGIHLSITLAGNIHQVATMCHVTS